jgi:hypothetical protein
MSLFPIFKVSKLVDKNSVDTILVFYGSNLEMETDELNDLFKDEPNNSLFSNIFSKSELDDIFEKKIDVEFINETIHIDDSIGSIKLKIFQAMNKNVSIDEMYMFCLKKEKINPVSMYQTLTQNDKLPLTRVRLNQMLLNIYDEDSKLIDFNIANKDKYTFDDILNLDLTNRDYLVAKILGQRLVFTSEYPFIADPFNVTEYDTLLERSRMEMSSLNNNLLLETGDIYNNNIYICMAENVFEMMELNDISTEYSAKIYYPFLYSKNIDDLDKLKKDKDKLITETTSKLNENTKRNFENIDMFYDIYQNSKPSNLFTTIGRETGISYIKITMYPDYKIKIPIDVIFKLLHATNEYPLIKFNPETRQENMYRLYADKTTSDGQKIPFLNKPTIFKLMKTIGKNKSVSVYTTTIYKGITYNMIVEFTDDGHITIYPANEFENPILLGESKENVYNDINTIFNLTINPLIEQIKPFFEESGLEINLFNSIEDSNVEIRDMTYKIMYSITNPIDFKKINGCVSSVFTIETDNFKKGVQMRYKRVSNFNKRDSQEAFVIEKIDQGLKIDDIIEELIKNYDDLDEESANELIIKIRSELELTRGLNKRRALMVKINPGFKTIMNLNLITSELLVSMSGINNIQYLNTIPVYVDSIIRITQDIKSTDVNISKINTLCSNKEIEEIEFDDIVALSEQSIDTNEIPIIENESPVYTKEKGFESIEQGKNMEDLLDILGYGDDESEELEGGQVSSSPELSDEIEGLSDIESPEVLSSKSLSSLPTPASKSLSLPSEKEVEVISDIESPEVVSSKTLSSLPTPTSKTSISPKQIDDVASISSSEQIQENDDDSISISSETPESEEVIEISEKIKEKEPSKEKIVESKIRDITGMRLKYPNPFTSKLEMRAPELFVKSKNEKIDLYTRMCPFNLSDKRQPVILTKQEKDKILAEHPDELNEEADFIEFSTDPNNPAKKFFYTCPRYWCLLTDTMVTEKDILEGKCGPKVDKIEDAIIPNGSDVVPKGKYVYQLYGSNEKKYPGFHKNKLPSGLCIPCCQTNWSTPTMKNRRDICVGKYKEKEALPVTEKEKEAEKEILREVQESETYVKGPEKYPLGEHRWGFLPIAVQKFLHEVNAECQISKTNTSLKPNHTCLLRHGVENNSNQSFIACIASALFYGQRDELTKKPLITKYIPNAVLDVPSIKEMKEIIINAIDIDKFLTYQNGDLVSVFSNSELSVNFTSLQEEYKKSKLWNKIISQQSNEEKYTEMFFKKVVQSFENFKLFLRDNKILIDYTYLWDLVTMPNSNLFETGINLIILEMSEDDVTNNIDLVCPTNYYSSHTYDARKRSLILLKRETYFEPIYAYRNDEKKIMVTKTFSEHDRNLPKTLRAVFAKIIKPTIGQKCRSFLSRPNEYRFKQAPLLDDLIIDIEKKKYKIITQVLNFQGKVIGVLAKDKNGNEGFIPCYPSALTTLKISKNKKYCDINQTSCDYDFVYMTDNSIWRSYEETLAFLKEYYNYKEPEDINKAQCFNSNYFCRVVEDEMITGFLSNTNQFIQIKEPVPVSSVDDNIKTIKSDNLLVADKNIQVSNKSDTKRTDFIKRIQLETNFYNVFRNTIRILFNDYKNSEQRKRILEESSRRYVLYREQLEKVIEMLHDLVDESILFATTEEGFNYKNVNENEIHNCIKLSKDKCNESDKSVCRVVGEKCVLVLPKNNLITNTDNEKYYYGRMADELIRYNRIKSYIFKPQSYLSFSQVKYNLRKDEIIVLQDLLNQEFFENLIPIEINEYAKYNTYDTAEPLITQKYKNEVEIDEVINPNHERTCFPSDPEPIKSIYWKNCFPENYSEINYHGSNYCLIYLVIDLLKEFKNKTITPEEIKDELIQEYNNLTENGKNQDKLMKLIDIIKEEGQFDANQLQDGTMTYEQMIINDGFTPVNFDLWILLEKYEIPSIFISSKLIPETRFNYQEFVCYTPKDREQSNYVFILTPAMYKRQSNKYPEYKIILNDKKNIKININNLKEGECLTNIEQAIINYYTIDDYISFIFEKDITTKYKLKKKGVRELDIEVEEEPEQDMEIEVIPKKRIPKKKKPRKIKPTIIIEEDDDEKIQPTEPEAKISEIEKLIDLPKEEESLEIEIIPKRTRKNRKLKVNPPGKRKTRKIIQEIEVVSE